MQERAETANIGLLTAAIGLPLVALIFVAHATTDHFAFFFGSALLVIISTWIMNHLTGVLHMRSMTIVGFFYLTYIIMIYIPAHFVFLDGDHPARYQYMVSVMSVLITAPLGVAFANLLLKFRREEIKDYYLKPVVGEKNNWVGAFLIFLGIAFLFTGLYISEIREFPILSALKNPGDYYGLTMMREDSFKLLDSKFTYIYSILRDLLYPILIIVSMGQYFFTKQKKWLIIFIATFSCGILYSAISLAKAPVANIFLLICLFYYLWKRGQVSFKLIVGGISFLLSFPIFVYLVASYGEDVTLFNIMILGIGRRIFYVPAETLYYYFQFIPYGHPYLHGQSVSKLAWLMGWKDFNLANEVATFIFQDKIHETTNMNAAFIGSLHADFGFPAVLLGGILVGFLMQIIQIRILRAPKDVLNLTLQAFMILSFWYLNSTTLPIVLLSNGVLLALIFPWIMKVSRQVMVTTLGRKTT